MKIDLNQPVAATPHVKWDLTVTINGRDLAVRPLTRDDLVKLAAIFTLSDEDQWALFAGLFNPAPTMHGWTGDLITAAVSAIINYMTDRHAKHKRAIGGAVARAMSQAKISLN